MASIRKRTNHYHVQARRRGISVTHSFDKLTTAKSWIAKVEGDIEQQIFLDTSETHKTTLLYHLYRCEDELISLHKGSKSEKYRIQHLKKHLGHLRLINSTPLEVSKYRDIRLETVFLGSLKREFVILSRVLRVPERGWGISIPKNPIPLVSLPKVDKGRTRRLERVTWSNRLYSPVKR